ncbi:uncharacterized protein G2W53_041690 [Senna tora]|uniref:Uncharacterized protein n=1 Tax=Senna tora TaxID=362788 RepID=A0A834W346_9FABA|nr:uncharacterized protein G2W53_041690 [Senna tora]
MRKESKAAKQTLEASTSAEQLEILSDISALFAESNPISESMAEEKTLREHAAPQVNQALLCIATPTLQAPLELKSSLIHLLPKFRGLMNEDPYRNLKEFHVVCSSMKPERVTEEQIKLRAFPFSLDGATKEWPQSPPSQQPSSSRSDSSLENIVKSLALNTQQFQMSTQQFQNETRSSIQSLETQVSKLATSMSKLESQGKLPSQTEANPRQNVRAITLRSEKEIQELPKTISRGHGSSAEAEPEAEVVVQKLPKRFDGQIVKFNAMKRPSEVSSICSVEVVNSEVHEIVELHQQENLGIVLSGKKSKESSNTGKKSEILAHELEAMNPKCGNSLAHDSPSSHTKVFPSLVQDPELKLKQLPKHLKHAFLEAQVEEERLITTLREYKDAIGRVIMDVKGFNSSTFLQRIVLEENYKPIQEAQSHLNPPMMEVFKKEFQKLLDTDMNYLVLDSKIDGKVPWVPKMTGVAVMKSSELGDNIVPKPPD